VLSIVSGKKRHIKERAKNCMFPLDGFRQEDMG
jgi:hypothetical protein